MPRTPILPDEQLLSDRARGLLPREIAAAHRLPPSKINWIQCRLRKLGVPNLPNCGYTYEEAMEARRRSRSYKEFTYHLGCSLRTAYNLNVKYNLNIPTTIARRNPPCSPPSSPTSAPPTSNT